VNGAAKPREERVVSIVHVGKPNRAGARIVYLQCRDESGFISRWKATVDAQGRMIGSVANADQERLSLHYRDVCNNSISLCKIAVSQLILPLPTK
jgi:hypothetical protein